MLIPNDYILLTLGIICSANNCKDLVSGKSGKCMVKYVTPIFKYLLISFNIVLGVPLIIRFEPFHFPFLSDTLTFLFFNSSSSLPRNKIPCHPMIISL